MGHHYTPNAHLQRFGLEQDSELIWMYDRQERTFKRLPCKVAAQSPKYYPADVETKLADHIEGPGNKSITKVLNHEELSDDDRFSLAAYMYVMRSRGPRQRRINHDNFPEIFEETMKEARAQVIENFQPDERELEIQLAHADRLQKEWKLCPPGFVERLLKTPHISPATIKAVYEMSWVILPAPEDRYYVTSDTPAHYFESLGIAREASEFTMTLSSQYALVAHRRGKPMTVQYHPKPERKLTDEINRRIIDTTENFVFAKSPGDWISTLCNKELRLNSIRWS